MSVPTSVFCLTESFHLAQSFDRHTHTHTKQTLSLSNLFTHSLSHSLTHTLSLYIRYTSTCFPLWSLGIPLLCYGSVFSLQLFYLILQILFHNSVCVCVWLICDLVSRVCVCVCVANM